METITENEAFLRSAAVTSLLDAVLLSTATAKIGRALTEPKTVAAIVGLSDRLADFLKFVTLAEAALADGQPETASYLGGFVRELLDTCDRISTSLEVHDLERVAAELDWISAILGDYPSFGGGVAIALRQRHAPTA